jgi:cell division septal protein FtsQ
MSTYPNIAQPIVFQRGEGVVRAKNAPRKVVVRFKHVALLFFIFAGIFFGLGRAYIFLISWNKLDIRSVEVICARPSLKAGLDAAFRANRLGNILLCDIERLRAQVRAFSWVQEARIQKVFPSALKVEITERRPRALIQTWRLALVDGEGVELQAANASELEGLPLLVDAGAFRKHRAEKLKQAWDCLDGLPDAERSRIAGLDLSDLGSVEVRFKDDPVRVRLGDREFGGSLRFYREKKAEWESRLGAPLDSVDLRFEDRVYITLQAPLPPEGGNGGTKEAE